MPERGEITINPGNNVFAERFAKNAEARIEADKIKNTHDNAVDMVRNNVDFFGRCDEEKQSEIAIRVLGRFGRGYQDVQSMINETNNPNKNQRIAHGDIDSLAESVRIAMDMSATGKDLVVDSMTAEQIDENLPKEMKGIGKRIKEKGLMDGVKDNLIEINNVIDQDNLFTTQNKVIRGEVYKKWGEKVKILPEGSYVKKYVEVARSVFEDLGVSDVIVEKKGEASVGLDQAAEKISAAAEKMTEAASKINESKKDNEDKSEEGEDEKLEKLVRKVLGRKKERTNQTESLTKIDQVYKILDEIEESGYESSDISKNSDRFKYLDKVMSGSIDVEGFDDAKNEKLADEIGMRLLLNDWFLMVTSGSVTLENMAKISDRIHKGTSDGELDKEFLTFFFKGANGLPVAEAWNLRQKAYFNYEEILRDIQSNHVDLITKNGYDVKDLFKFKAEMEKNDVFGIDRDYNPNLLSDPDIKRKKMVNEYMLKKLGGLGSDEEKNKRAKKAVELAKKLSAATFEDSAANINFARADEYAEVILFKFLRVQDGLKKGKQMGTEFTYKEIESLTPSWLRSLRKVSEGQKQQAWSELRAEEIDVDKINGANDLVYHTSILNTQVAIAKELLIKPMKFEDLAKVDKIKMYFSKINKTVKTASGSGLKIFYNDHYNNATLEQQQGVMRSFFIENSLALAASDPNSGWTATGLDTLKEMVTGNSFLDENGKKVNSFITLNQWNYIDNLLNIRKRLKIYENIERRAKRWVWK